MHASIYRWFGISCDRFGRTPTWQQTAIAQSLFAELEAAGLLKEESVEQLYSEAAGTFLADRFVEGTCPKCGYNDARGDQCDGCGEFFFFFSFFSFPSCSSFLFFFSFFFSLTPSFTLSSPTPLLPRVSLNNPPPQKKLKNNPPPPKKKKKGGLLNPTELLEPRCKMTGTTPVVRSTRHVFLDLPSLTPDLDAYHAACASGGGWTSNCATTTAAWMRDGLKPRCISRDLRWGTRVPRAGFEEKVLYVWFDAPVGYVSITATLTRGWEAWWRPREGTEVELVQFMGKDNVPFHTVIFPATLLGASRGAAASAAAGGATNSNASASASASASTSSSSAAATSPAGNGASDDPLAPSRPWALARAISVTEYLNYEGGEFSMWFLIFLCFFFFEFFFLPKRERKNDPKSLTRVLSFFFSVSFPDPPSSTGKFSKSRGLGVFGDDAARAGLSPDVWRFYLLSSRPETSDTDFKWSDLAARTNAELLANLGNFCHRALSFTASKLGGAVPRSAAEVLRDAGASSSSSSSSPAAALLAESEVVKAAAAAAADLTAKVAPLAASYLAAMEKAKLREGARLLMVRGFF